MKVASRVLVSTATVLAHVMLTYRHLESPVANARVPLVPVVVAAEDIPEGRAINRTWLVVAGWPVGTVPAGAYTSIDSIAGRVSRVPIFKGEAIVPGRLAPDATGPGLEVKITPGKRAMSFRVNDVSGIAGLIQPNSRVDIHIAIGAGERRLAKLFMENMRVLAIGAVPRRAADGRAINASVATVEVTPEEGERLALATTQGEIQLVLRGYGNPDSVKTDFATTVDTRLNRTVPAPPPPIPPRPDVSVFRHTVIYR